MKYLLGILVVLMISQVYAVCESGQIDVNSASLKKLDELKGIGPVKAQAIIDYRDSELFESIDDLIDVYGIGPVTLQKIKDQGLACVDEEGEEEENEEDTSVEEIDEQETESLIISSGGTQIKKNPELETIKLNTKDIKSNGNKKNLDKSDYAKYGFVVFCVLLGLLFIFKKKRFKKNEFN